MKAQVLNSKSITQLLCVPQTVTQSIGLMKEASEGCVYLGSTLKAGIPCFINFDLLLNPHVFVCGITGSGKTYLMKNLVLKIISVKESSILILDLTGEYVRYATQVGIVNADPTALTKAIGKSYEESASACIDFSRLRDERQKIAAVNLALDRVVLMMRSSGVQKGIRYFVILDEAWKLIKNSDAFETLLREGRKYGLGLVLASQLVEDIDLPLLSNVATMFIFRVQNRHSLEKLGKNYGLDPEDIMHVQNLSQGSCMLIQLYKSRKRRIFMIRRICGVEIGRFAELCFGDGMNLEIRMEELEAMLRNICAGAVEEVMPCVEEKGAIGLDELIKKLLPLGVDRQKVLKELRKAGINDAEIADAFAIAINSLHEKGRV